MFIYNINFFFMPRKVLASTNHLGCQIGGVCVWEGEGKDMGEVLNDDISE